MRRALFIGLLLMACKTPLATAPGSPMTAEQATKLVERANGLFQKGQYKEAEPLLKQAIATSPFIARAHLLLGKIFLIEGAGAHDKAKLQSARLMFEIAHRLDPDLHEAEILLQLFVEPIH
jgi:Tfp pilus assembly protein PilF